MTPTTLSLDDLTTTPVALSSEGVRNQYVFLQVVKHNREKTRRLLRSDPKREVPPNRLKAFSIVTGRARAASG